MRSPECRARPRRRCPLLRALVTMRYAERTERLAQQKSSTEMMAKGPGRAGRERLNPSSTAKPFKFSK